MTPEQANQMLIEVQTIADKLALIDYFVGILVGGLVAIAFWLTAHRFGGGS